MPQGEQTNIQGPAYRLQNPGLTCIWNALTDYHPNQLNVLLQRGADPCPRDNNGDTPLNTDSAAPLLFGILSSHPRMA